MAAISEVKIANLALSHIGSGQIESLDEASAGAIQCKLWYDEARLQTLEAYNWAFARKRQLLAAHGDDPPLGQWAFRYQYPADCVIARELENPLANTGFIGTSNWRDTIMVSGDAVPFEVEVSDDETKSILTNLDDATLIYTFDQDSPQMFSRLFIMAMSHLLASYIAFALTGKQSLVDRQRLIWEGMIRMASATAANEGVAPPPREAEWIRGR